jgi:hypothetical protein
MSVFADRIVLRGRTRAAGFVLPRQDGISNYSATSRIVGIVVARQVSFGQIILGQFFFT